MKTPLTRVLSLLLSAVVIGWFVLSFKTIFAVTFDESFASATGVRSGLYNSVISVLTAVVIVVGMRLMGALLISSLTIFPSLTAMRVCRSFRNVTICSAVVSVSCFTAGLIASYYLDIPTGAGIVVLNLIVFVVFAGIGAVQSSRGLAGTKKSTE